MCTTYIGYVLRFILGTLLRFVDWRLRFAQRLKVFLLNCFGGLASKSCF
jgi:hypothetical protein